MRARESAVCAELPSQPKTLGATLHLQQVTAGNFFFSLPNVAAPQGRAEEELFGTGGTTTFRLLDRRRILVFTLVKKAFALAAAAQPGS